MSAFIVGKPHIDALVTVAVHGPKDGEGRWDSFRYYYHDGKSHDVNTAAANAIGSMLWQENYASVEYRYPDTADLPGPCDLTAAEVLTYHWQKTRIPTIAEAIKALDCYEYQSCEHPGWETSQAKAFIARLTDALTSVLPGYDAAPWEWTDEPAVLSR
jgi:hypothetical protein